MTLNKRERALLIATIAVALVVLNYLLISRLWGPWQRGQQQLAARGRELAGMQAQIARQPQWQQENDTLRQSLGQGEQRFAQPSDVLKKIEEVGAAAGILISSRQPMLAVDKEIYRELPVKCSFDATTESLVKFLYGLQTGSGFINVEQLQVFPRTENPDILRCDIQIRALTGKTEGPAS
jgi:Tfp pilus assembly protein PilO